MNALIYLRTNRPPHARQSGAALVVALILLVALSLMAISSMNTASLDLIMAGNEQYRSRAFVAAEAGIERALLGGTFSTSADFTQNAVNLGTGNDKYSYVISRPNSGAVESPPPGNSEGTFGTVYFRITSSGVSERDTGTTHIQELYQVVQAGDSLGCNTAVGSCTID